MNLGWLLVMYFLWFGIIMAGGAVTSAIAGLILAAIATGILCGIGYFLK